MNAATIYAGKTSASLPKYPFPSDWNITFKPNHWSNEDTMKQYIEEIIVPYLQRTKEE